MQRLRRRSSRASVYPYQQGVFRVMFVIRRLISIESISIDLSSAIDLITFILDQLHDHVLTLLVMHIKEIRTPRHHGF